jgi:hypothetical protein
MVSYVRSDDALSVNDQLQISANLLGVANALPDYDQAKHAYDLARRSYENAARNLGAESAAGLREELHDLGVRLLEFEWELTSHTNWSQRLSFDQIAARNPAIGWPPTIAHRGLPRSRTGGFPASGSWI